MGHVDGTLVPPPRFDLTQPHTPNDKHLVWKVANQHLLNILLSSLTKEAIAEVVGLIIACDVWLALENYI